MKKPYALAVTLLSLTLFACGQASTTADKSSSTQAPAPAAPQTPPPPKTSTETPSPTAQEKPNLLDIFAGNYVGTLVGINADGDTVEQPVSITLGKTSGSYMGQTVYSPTIKLVSTGKLGSFTFSQKMGINPVDSSGGYSLYTNSLDYTALIDDIVIFNFIMNVTAENKLSELDIVAWVWSFDGASQYLWFKDNAITRAK